MTVLRKDYIVRTIPGSPGVPAVPAIPARPGYYTTVAVARPGPSNTAIPTVPPTTIVTPEPDPTITYSDADAIISWNHPALQVQNWRYATWEEIATLFTGGLAFYSQRKVVVSGPGYNAVFDYRPVSKCDVSVGMIGLIINTPKLHTRLPYIGTGRISNMAVALIESAGTYAPYICVGNFPGPIDNPVYKYVVENLNEGEYYDPWEHYECELDSAGYEVVTSI